MHVLSSRTSKYMMKNFTEQKIQTNQNTVADFKAPSSVIDKTNRQKISVNS